MNIDNNSKNYFLKIYSLVFENKLKLAFMPIYFIISSILDLVGVTLIGTYIGYIVDENLIKNDKFYYFVNLWKSISQIDNNILAIGLLLVIIFLLKSILGIFIHRETIKFSHDTQANLRQKLMRAYRSMEYSEYVKRDSSEYISAVGALVKSFGVGLTASISFLGDIIVTIAFIILLSAISSSYLFFLGGSLLFLIFIYKKFLLDGLNKKGTELNHGYAKMYQGINEFFLGFKELKILNSFDSFEKKILNSTNLIAKNDVSASFIAALPKYLLELVLIIFITSIFSFAIITNKDLDSILPTISIFAVAALRLVPIASQFTRYIAAFKFSKNAVDLLFIDAEKAKKNYLKNRNEQINSDFKELEFLNVNFTYDRKKGNMLENINFKITKGESIAIIGPSGSGKTTILNLMLKLIDPISGQVFYNNKKLELNVDIWRSQVAYLPQETFLINDSIRANIALGINSDQIDDQKIQECIDNVHLRDFINNLKDGVETNVSERGLSISGGQRQRIAFARAFYFNRNILILDEPTSSIDQDTESEIIEYLGHLKDNKTIIIISHKLDTIKFCDQIYEIKNNTMKKR